MMIKHFLFILIFIASFTIPSKVNAQIKKKEKTTITSLGLGFSGGDFANTSCYGPDLNLHIQKRLFKMGKEFNGTLDLDAIIFLGFFDEIPKTTFNPVPVSALTFNFNGLVGVNPKTRSPLGGFLGFGVLAIPTRSETVATNNAGVTVTASGDIGPYANAGFRIKPGKHFYFTMKVFGGVTLRYEYAYGGLNFLIPISKNEDKKKFANHACKKHSKRKM